MELEESQLFNANCNFKICLEEVKTVGDILENRQMSSLTSEDFSYNNELFRKYLNGSYWLSWIVMNQTYQSDEFSFGERKSIMMKSENSVTFKYFFRPEKMFSYLPKEIISIFPLTFYLCNNEGVFGTLLCDPFNIQDHISSNIQSIKLTFPLQFEHWLPFTPIAVTNTPIEENNFVKSLLLRVRISIETDYQMAPEIPPVITEKKELPLPSPPPKRPATPDPVVEEEPESTDEIEENTLRHFRIHLNLYSLKGLNHPAYLSLQFTYPYFGVTNVIKTPPQYYPMRHEMKIEKGTITYECMTTRSRLKEILSQYPLKLELIQKSHLGNELLGFGLIPLFPVQPVTQCNDPTSTIKYQMSPHSFRCPITQQTFQTFFDYQKHYEKLLVLYKQKEISVVPSREPEIIYANDQFIDLEEYSSGTAINEATSVSGRLFSNQSKLRVISIIEDKGKVGKEIALKVGNGYKMQNGGIYKMNEANPILGFPSNTSAIQPVHTQVKDTLKATVQDQSQYLNSFPTTVFPEGGSSSLVDKLLGSSPNIPPANEYPGMPKNYTPSISLNMNDYDSQNKFIDHLLMDWELFRQKQENEWKKSLYEKEALLKKEIEKEYSQKFYHIIDDMKRSKQEISKLEIRLKTSLELVDKEKLFLTQQKDNLNTIFKQKSNELIILMKKNKLTCNLEIEKFKNEKNNLENNNKILAQQNLVLERKLNLLQENYDNLYQKYKYSNEMKLKEEIISLKNEISNYQEKLAQELKLKENIFLEKEYYRSQMYKLATCLKREREKNNLMIKQELEHLRLEFLAREERYVRKFPQQNFVSNKSKLIGSCSMVIEER